MKLRKLQVSEKGPGDFVTASDKGVEKVIIEELNVDNSRIFCFKRGRGGLVGGKSGNKDGVIDPIDGTTQILSNGLPHFAISIGYEENRRDLVLE